MLILAMETSCDETSVALFGDALIGQVIRSQIKLHRPYGGVVPRSPVVIILNHSCH